MKYVYLIFTIFFLASCQDSHQQVTVEDDSEVIATVGDMPVTANLLRAYLKANGVTRTDTEALNMALDNLINEIAMGNAAKKKGIHLTKEQVQGLRYLEIRAFSSAAQQDYLKDVEVSEQEIEQAYNLANQQIGGMEYHIHHLLYKDEVEAIKIRDGIKSTEDYLELEKEYLKDNPGQRNVGDLSWVTLGQLPESFRKILPQIKAGTVLKDTLKSPYGAHIVYLQETRAITPPKLEDVKHGIINTIKKEKLSKFAQLARAKTKVTIKE